jgi:hypothetical protein
MVKNKKKVLGDHKKVGSKFIPPMCQLGMTEVSYVNRIFPEILWMGLLNKREGYRTGIKIVEFMAKRLSELKTSEKFLNFSLASSYMDLSDKEKSQIVDHLNNEKFLSILQQALAPLTCLYDGFPMSFIGPPIEHIGRDTLIKILKTCISECINKYGQPGMVMQASVMYIRGITGGLYFANGMKPPDLEKIIKDFDSEEGKRAAASVRAFVMSEYMPMGEKKTDNWARSFWNQGYKIDKCHFPWEENE